MAGMPEWYGYYLFPYLFVKNPEWEPDPRRAFAFSSVYARANSKTSLKTRISKTRLQDSLERGVQRGETSKSASKPIWYDYDDRTWRGIKQADLDFWTDDFDGVYVMAELRKMKAWLDCHPKKKDFKRFIVGWLTRSQGRSTTFAGRKR